MSNVFIVSPSIHIFFHVVLSLQLSSLFSEIVIRDAFSICRIRFTGRYKYNKFTATLWERQGGEKGGEAKRKRSRQRRRRHRGDDSFGIMKSGAANASAGWQQ